MIVSDLLIWHRVRQELLNTCCFAVSWMCQANTDVYVKCSCLPECTKSLHASLLHILSLFLASMFVNASRPLLLQLVTVCACVCSL